MAGATTPWLTGMSVMGWIATGGAITAGYPVNDAPPFNPRILGSAPGRRYVGYYQRQQNRYIGVGTAGCSFNIDITGQTALSTGYWFGDALMQACGFDVSGTTLASYMLQSPNVGDANVVRADLKAQYQDGVQYTIGTAVGGATFSFVPGEIPNVTFDMVGIDSPQSLGTTISLTTTPYGQALAGATFNITPTGYTARTQVLRSLSIATNPMISARRSVAGTGGYAAPVITGYECSALARVELDATTHDFESSWAAGSMVSSIAPLATVPLALSLAFPVGGAGTIVGARTLTVSGNFLLDGMPQRVDDDGVLCLDVPLILDPSTILAGTSTNSLKFVWSA
jgi:hypothetical protein